MFYRMINTKRDEWFNSSECTVRDIIDYMITKGEMRDVQIDAIKTYLFLKIACDNKPLWFLFSSGKFNNLDVDNLEISAKTAKVFKKNPAALALYEYATLKNDKGEQVSERLADEIKSNTENIDYHKIFKNLFYDVQYTDYLFSLPMGAGKTYLMAAFIYLDLYFAMNEPDNKAFAHNFIIFAPSGLKSSVVPSLKTIQRFNPAWVLPEPAASDIKRMIKFEVLDQPKTANKSNKIKNPNVQKIAIYQPLNELKGLVAVTNAEKVILDRIVIENGQINMFEESEDDKDRQANELRNLIGKLPNLSIFIDEVHHAVSDEIKLRAVINSWNRVFDWDDVNFSNFTFKTKQTVNSVIGFSGTPYLEKAEKIDITDSLSIKNAEISNVVFYYPLVDGIDNFLKKPTVKISSNNDSLQIIESGLRDFLNLYKDKVYQNGLTAKLGIYCGKIETLEEVVYPAVAGIISEYGFEPDEVILKYHKGNSKYKIPPDSQLEFESLDKTISKIRVILLVQIGKEGWDCKSLTGIILSQKGDCPTNMVLQTSCRCLRQVVKGESESALIWLNEFNGEKLENQLRQQHHISIKELENARNIQPIEINRYNRMDYLKLPPVDYYQLKVEYHSIVLENKMNITEDIQNAITEESKISSIVKIKKDLVEEASVIDIEKEKGNRIADFNQWLYEINKESFGFLSMYKLYSEENALKEVFNTITYEKDGCRFYSSKFHIPVINANIRKAFYEKRTFDTKEEIIPESATLLRLENFSPLVKTKNLSDYYPSNDEVERIVRSDAGKLKPDKKTMEIISSLEKIGQQAMAAKLKEEYIAKPEWNKTFHYVPYKNDSGFEQNFLNEVLKFACFQEMNLEIYYNGDRKLSDFKIKCFKGGKGKWNYIGMYTPDFLILQRRNKKIFKAIIVETKGSLFANDPKFKAKKEFMETEFLEQNNKKFGYKRFGYLYLQDNLSEIQRIRQTAEIIEEFFKEDK
jgi:type III restriction enzyme